MDLKRYYKEKDITVCVTGHRDICISPTDDNAKQVIKLFLELIDGLYKKGKRRFVSGGADGVDNLFAYAVSIYKKTHNDIENVIAIPFKDQYNFPLFNKQRSEELNKKWFNFYRYIMSHADTKIYVDTLAEYKVNNTIVGKFNAQKFFKRNEFMVDISSIVIDIFRGEVADKAAGPRSGTKHCINYAIKKERIVIHMNPENNFKKQYIVPV